MGTKEDGYPSRSGRHTCKMTCIPDVISDGQRKMRQRMHHELNPCLPISDADYRRHLKGEGQRRPGSDSIGAWSQSRGDVRITTRKKRTENDIEKIHGLPQNKKSRDCLSL